MRSLAGMSTVWCGQAAYVQCTPWLAVCTVGSRLEGGQSAITFGDSLAGARPRVKSGQGERGLYRGCTNRVRAGQVSGLLLVSTSCFAPIPTRYSLSRGRAQSRPESAACLDGARTGQHNPAPGWARYLLAWLCPAVPGLGAARRWFSARMSQSGAVRFPPGQAGLVEQLFRFLGGSAGAAKPPTHPQPYT
jgi:hypothetical protein